MSELALPAKGLIVLVGVSGSGKSYFARRHFLPTQVISSDHCRAVVSDDENDQAATGDAFELLHHIVATRLRRGLLTVVDATNVQPRSRQELIRLARDHDVLAAAVVLDVPERVAADRNAAGRNLPPHVIPRQVRELRRGLRALGREFRRVHHLRGVEEIDAATVVLEKPWNDRRDLTGPFDLIGDVHGCRAELEELLADLGYVGGRHPDGRTAVFVGDLVDRGPDTPGVLRLVMRMVAEGTALCVSGNHENKLARALQGRKVKVTHGLAESLEQLGREPEAFRDEALAFMNGLIGHYVLDGGALVVAHAGLKEAYHGRTSGRVRSFALYGDTTGETDEYGLPVRYPWAEDYRGRAAVVYGHTPVPRAEWVNNTICLDTGCVFGGELTALRYPEREIVSRKAHRVWYEPSRPPGPPPSGRPGPLRSADVLGAGGVETRLLGRVTVRPENAAAALEVMSRFAIDPRWLVYLPPTMAPAPTHRGGGYLEHPAEALEAYASAGVTRVVCEEKHMGSRAVAVVCGDADTAAARFGVEDGSTGAVYTRTGRSFFGDPALTEALLARLRAAAAPLFAELDTGWLAFDCELLPWSVKALELIRVQYAATGAAALAALPAAARVLEQAAGRGLDVADLRERTGSRLVNAGRFRDVYTRYCRPVDGLDGVRLAPFQVLAGEGVTYATARDHLWHLEVAGRLAAADPLLAPTRSLVTADPDEAAAWWEELTEAGGEGMVVKPLDGHGPRVQPGLKVRGREYLRIIYGPDYTGQRSLDRLRDRSLGRKRSLAMREHALGLEALDRLTAGEPTWRVHQAVFAVLALESEPVDPRL